MKKVEIKQFTHAEIDAKNETFGFLKIPAEHKLIRAEGENLEVSDGYHTFDELYEHRITLFIALARILRRQERQLPHVEGIHYVWRSKLHSDETSFEGWFVLGLGWMGGEQMTYHLPDSKWNETDFAETLDKAPEFDGHTSEDTLKRLKNI